MPSHQPPLTRRAFLARGGAGALALGLPAALAARPRVAGAQGTRPAITHGVQSGDVGAHRAVVWARADRESRMVVELAATESFANAERRRGPLATEATDFTARVDLDGLPAGEDVFYRVTFEDLARPERASEPAVGRLRTAPRGPGDVSFVWGGDTAGQGWGINPDFGGMRLYETMRATQPDFFIHSGDTIYADGPITETVALPDGGVWRNLVTEEKAKVAETLAEFRGNHAYNLLDENVRRFNAEVPSFVQWDDHETTNNWYPGEALEDPRYTVRDVDLLAARGRRAFLEYFPTRPRRLDAGRIYRAVRYGPALELFFLDMRTYRGPNTANDQPAPGPDTAFLGARQLAWLKARLRASTATWKVIAADMPIGLVVGDGPSAFEAIAQGDGPPLGRELEIADLLGFLAREGVRNTVWVTADVHFTAAHRYDPARARLQDFTPFWEFVSGPLHAGSFPANRLDDTFGPEVVYVNAPTTPNRPPSDGLQFFGHAAITRDTQTMTVRLVDLAGTTLFSVDLPPAT